MPRGRHHRPDQAVPAADRRRPDRPGGARGSGVRLPRAQRLRQDHHDPDAARADLGHRGTRSGCSASRCPPAAGTALRRVGSLVEGPAFHPYLSGRANLARLDAADRASDPRTSRARVDAALDRVGLLAAAQKRYRAYSLGMRQRLAIANALLMPRDLLVLDEPTNGLDPQGTREVRHLIGDLAGDGVDRAGVRPPAGRGRPDVQPRRGDVRGEAGLPGLDGRPALLHGADRPGGHRPRPTEDAARVLRELSLADVTVGAGLRHGDPRRGGGGEDRARTWSTTACRCWASPCSSPAWRTSSCP